MDSSRSLVHVLLPTGVDTAFTYLVPEGMVLARGDMVVVPFGRRRLKGVVWDTASQAVACDPAKLKSVESRIPIPPLSAALLDFIGWLASYTLSPLGLVLKMVMSVPDALEPPAPEKMYRLVEPLPAEMRLTPARQTVIDALKTSSPRNLTELQEESGASAAVIQGLVKTGILEVFWQEALLSDPVVSFLPPNVPTLSSDQEQAVSVLLAQQQKPGFAVTLLDGVTGSGKTEVYFAVIEEVLKRNEGQVLILLPEIVLTAQLLERFTRRFGFTPALWHSEVSRAVKRDTWKGVASGKVRLVVGARSGLFLPFKKLSLMVIDEEHESAFKQEEGVIYHARDMAVVRAMKEQIPIILASATPSLETLANVASHRYGRVHLPSRHGEAVMPEIQVVDMRNEWIEAQTFVSPTLRKAITETLSAGKQAMLFLNRRGYAPLTLCRGCGHRLECPDCSSWLVEHRKKHQQPVLQCHHCGYHRGIPDLCPGCGADKELLIPCGPGVERVAEEVAAFLPEARISLMTSDTISTAAKAVELIGAITSGQTNVIIGTQMMAKGHHFPNLTLVGVVDADLGLVGGDPRAAERTYQLLHQVSGRAGREADPGKVILQSYMPDNAVLQALQDTTPAGRDAFMAQEMESRKMAEIAPFGRMAAVVISGKNEAEVVTAAKLLAKSGSTLSDVQLYGPAPAPIYQLRGNFRYRLLFKAKREFPIQKALHWVIHGVPLPSSTRLKVDIDPYNFL
ncbi:MAG: primosomal protein [Rickettsiales bacterium]|jgi:primosomal protein N' (replication factor Y)|nr:primosomal protein [Rickettsiales bacterium]